MTRSIPRVEHHRYWKITDSCCIPPVFSRNRGSGALCTSTSPGRFTITNRKSRSVFGHLLFAYIAHGKLVSGRICLLLLAGLYHG